MARYYLGKKVGEEYTPIPFENEDGKLLSVLKYTALFNSDAELKEELKEKKVIDENDSLYYLTGQKDEYCPIFNGDSICYSNMQGLLSANDLLVFLKDQKYNYELFYYLFESLIKKYKYRENVPALIAMDNLLCEINFANRVGEDAYLMLEDKRDLNHLIFEFTLAAIGKYDRKKKQFVMENGKVNISDRQLCDLLLLLNNYFIIKRREQEYNETNKNNNTNDEIVYDEYEKEEFLTEEDFISTDQDPDDFRHLIRK